MSSKAVTPAAPVKTSPVPSTATPVATAPAVANAATAAKARAGRKLVDPNETPEAAFKRLTEPRVTKALKAIKQLKNLSRFKPTDAHRAKVFGAIREALTVAETSWKGTGEAASEGFTL